MIKSTPTLDKTEPTQSAFPFPHDLDLDLPDLLLERGLEQSQQQEFLALIRRVVVQRQDHRLHELGRATLRHLEDELREVDGIRLEQVEEVLVGLESLSTLFRECSQTELTRGGQGRRRVLTVLLQRLVM